MIEVKHVTFSRSGGAGRVAQQLFEYQRNLEYFQSSIEIGTEEDLRTQTFKNLNLVIPALIDEYIVKKDSPTLFSLFRDKDNKHIKNVIQTQSQIIHLHWIEGIIGKQVLMDLLKSADLKVWTIHDMAPLTGGCHYSLGCNKYQFDCSGCPMVQRIFWGKVKKKKNDRNEALKSANNTVLVFPTQKFMNKFGFLAEYTNIKRQVIPNPVADIFFNSKKNKERKRIVLGFISSQLNNPIKGYKGIIKILDSMSQKLDLEIQLLAVGDNKLGERHIQVNSKFSILETGKLVNNVELVKSYQKMNINLALSQEESFGLTIAEASAVGVPTLIIGETASTELIQTDLNGWITKDENEFVNLLEHLLVSKKFLDNRDTGIKQYAQKLWSIEKVHEEYEKIYNGDC